MKANFLKYSQVRDYFMKFQRGLGRQTLHELVRFLIRNRNAEESKVSKVYKILQKLNVRESNTKKQMGNSVNYEDSRRRLERSIFMST